MAASAQRWRSRASVAATIEGRQRELLHLICPEL
jgi:hypothetical protein